MILVIIMTAATGTPVCSQDRLSENTGDVWPPKGPTVVCPVSRDTWVSSVDGERMGNNGRASRLKVKGRQEFTLLDVNLQGLKGRLITGALLHLRSSTPDRAPLARLGISSVAGSWREGSSNYYRPQEGSACFEQGGFRLQDWAYPGSNLLDVVFSRGHTLWKFADCSIPDQKGWQSCAVDPDVVAARLAGLSEGFCIFDDLGSVWGIGENGFNYAKLPNRFFYSKESRRNGPWMEVWVSGEDRIPPPPVADISVDTRTVKPGEVMISWRTPGDSGGGKILGFQVYYKQGNIKKEIPRYLIPMAGPAGKIVKMHIRDLGLMPGEEFTLTIRPVDNAGNVGLAFSRKIRTSDRPRRIESSILMPRPFSLDTRLPVISGLKIGVVDMLDKIDPVTGEMIPSRPRGYKGGNHLFCARQKKIRLYGARNEHLSFQVNLEGRAEHIEISLEFHDRLLSSRVYEFGYINIENGKGRARRTLPDPLLVLNGTFSIPSTAGKVRLDNQANHSLICEVYIPDGTSPGLKRGALVIKTGQEELKFSIELNVHDFTLPDKLSFVPEMNAYGSFIPFDSYDYYRLAHEHRTCLNRLPYGWKGDPYFAPAWKNGRFDWRKWDRFMEPLFTGTAFDDLPRKGQPVDVFYLPFNENWPARVQGNFLKSYWADEAFKPGYEEELSRAFRAFATHVEAKGWKETRFQFYLNNKVYYRKTDRDSSAPWIFDEPENIQDFWALRWYGALWHSAVDPVVKQSCQEYRCDISYGEYKRNILDGIMDVEYIGGENQQILRMNREGALKYAPHEFVEYGNVNSVEQGNFQPVTWCRQAWFKNGRGVLPWQTIGSKKDWTKNARNALFYPGGKGTGPVPSVRLKAFTRGQQDTEYLELFSQGHSVNRHEIPNILKRIAGADVNHSEPSSAVTLWKSRAWLGKMISVKKTVPVVNREKGKEANDHQIKVPDIGYAQPSPRHKRVRPNCSGDCF